MSEDQKAKIEEAITPWVLAFMLFVAHGYSSGWWSGAMVFFWLFAFFLVGLVARVAIWLFR